MVFGGYNTYVYFDHHSMSRIRVAIGSTSKQKIEAVKHAFGKRGTAFDVLSASAPSGVNEQPVWHEETRTGALNRLAKAHDIFPDADYTIGIESGIINVGNKWHDFWHIVVQKKNGETWEGMTQTVEFPNSAVEEAQRRWFETTTVGSVLSENWLIDGTNPHASLTQWVAGRTYLIADALYIALNQLDYFSENPNT